MIVTQGQPTNFAASALGETAPIAASTGYFYAEEGVSLLGKFALYGELYRRQPWLATVIDKVAGAQARLPINVWDVTPETGSVLDKTSAYAQFWRKPCPLMPTYAFKRWTATTYELYGEAFWLKLRAPAGDVIGVVPMHPSRTAVKRDKDTGDLRYQFSLGVGSAGILDRPADDVVPFLSYNPDNLMRGLSRAEALRSTLENEDAARRAQASFWRKGARPSLMVSSPNGLTDRAYERLKSVIDSQHGGVDRAGGTLLLEEGAKPVPIQLSMEEMQYIESRRLNREEVCGRWDVPPPVVQILDRATFSNITEQFRALYRDTMTPRIEDFESTIDFHLRPEFDPDGSLKASLDMTKVLRGDPEKRAIAVQGLVTAGVMKPAEGRDEFDLPKAGLEADRLYANASLQPLGREAQRVTVTDEVPESAADDQDAAAEQSDDDLATSQGRRRSRTRAVVEYPTDETSPRPVKQAEPVRRGGRPPKSKEPSQ